MSSRFGPLGRLQHHRTHLPQLVDAGVPVGQGHLDLGPDHRQRGAQLVRGVGDEPALGVEGGLQPVQHLVERVGQVGHLVPRARAA